MSIQLECNNNAKYSPLKKTTRQQDFVLTRTVDKHRQNSEHTVDTDKVPKKNRKKKHKQCENTS